ncbi:MAG: CoB--CoM heterodisulfide reductase iron-sulfur subunit B family protein [Methanosarcinaceae archaeon]|nr:CoB--CoM heterodisulfide reductase iron-sulfur subunit B family protein [Methanosarcinaceae archaeon]
MEDIPDRKLLLFKSCMVSQEYPGIEKATKYLFDRLGIDYFVSEEQSCCTGIGHYVDLYGQLTTTAIAARNFAVARKCGYPNIACMCSTCYAINKEACELLNGNEEVRAQVNSVFREKGLEDLVYAKGDLDERTNIFHVLEVIFSKKELLTEMTEVDFSGLKAAAHHACHYYKFRPEDMIGNPENPRLIDGVAGACGADMLRWYEDRSLTCGMGFAQLHIHKDTSLKVTQTKLESLRKAGVELLLHMCPNCHIQYDRCQPVIEKEFGSEYDFVHMNIAQFAALALGADPYKVCGLQTHSVPLESFLEKYGII